MGGGMPGGAPTSQQMQQLMSSGGTVKAEFKGPKPPTPSPQEAAYNAAQGGGQPAMAGGQPPQAPTAMNPAAIMAGLQSAGMMRPGGGLTSSGLPGATPTLGAQQNILRALAGRAF